MNKKLLVVLCIVLAGFCAFLTVRHNREASTIDTITIRMDSLEAQNGAYLAKIDSCDSIIRASKEQLSKIDSIRDLKNKNYEKKIRDINSLPIDSIVKRMSEYLSEKDSK